MSAVEHTIRAIAYKVPIEVINAVFNECSEFSAGSIDEFVRLEIINGRVFRDIDLINGETAYLDLTSGVIREDVTGRIAVFFSDEYLQGREIISATVYHDQLYGDGLSGNIVGGKVAANGGGFMDKVGNSCGLPFGSSNNSELRGALSKLKQNTAPVIPNLNTKLTVIAKNTILMNPNFIYNNGGYVEVQLSNDPYLNNLAPRAWHNFADLCTLALKSYTYNKLFIKLGHPALVNGQNLQQLTEYVSGLSNAEDDYQEYLRGRWAKVSFMNDTNRYHGYIKSHMNPST